MTSAQWATRDTTLRELMDDPACDPRLLARTYAQFAPINRLVSGWRRIYRQRIRPLLSTITPTTLLDIGFGGGDIPRAIAAWAHRDGLLLHVTAIDPDPRAVNHARTALSDGVTFTQASSADVVASGERFDIVTSNHLLHHLTGDELSSLLSDSVALARTTVIHNDLARGRLGYWLYAGATLPFARSSFVHTDGLLSIRRSYRRHELQAAIPDGWRVESMMPQRLLLSWDGGS